MRRMNTESWLLAAIFAVLLYGIGRLADLGKQIAKNVEDIQDRYRHLHPVGRYEREELEKEDREDNI
jgi:Sec-independent protein translocase protein TatA